MQSDHFVPVNAKPTRLPSHEQSGNPPLLDHIWFNSLCKYSLGMFSIDITDYWPTFIRISFSVKCTEKIKLNVRSHSATDVTKFMEALANKSFIISNPSEVFQQTEQLNWWVTTVHKNSRLTADILASTKMILNVTLQNWTHFRGREQSIRQLAWHKNRNSLN